MDALSTLASQIPTAGPESNDQFLAVQSGLVRKWAEIVGLPPATVNDYPGRDIFDGVLRVSFQANDAGDPDLNLTFSTRLDSTGSPVRVVQVPHLYIPPALTKQGYGTALVSALCIWWARADATRIEARATSQGRVALAKWGFRLANNGPRARPQWTVDVLRAHSLSQSGACPAPGELRDRLDHLLSVHPATDVDMRAICDLATSDGDRYGQRLLLAGEEWEAVREVPAAWATGNVDLRAQ